MTEGEQMAEAPRVICAGQLIEDFEDRVRRYCGLSWSGGEPETWAYHYYDGVPTGVGGIEPIDVLACAAMHAGLSRAELTFFHRQKGAVEDWLGALPDGLELADADDAIIRHLARLAVFHSDQVPLSLLSKVLHRKRPSLIPLFDRDLADWYRPIINWRGVAAWPTIVVTLRSDLAHPDTRRVLTEIQGRLRAELPGPVPSHLRLVDIGIWMKPDRA